MRSFIDLLTIHRELDSLFTRHQHALLHFDFPSAGELLHAYKERLEHHMVFEEEHPIPLYEERASIERGGETKLFLDEHAKMRNFVQLFVEATDQLAGEGSPEDPVLT